MSYYLTYLPKKILVSEGEKLLLEVIRGFNWKGRLFYKFYHGGTIIMECSYYTSLFFSEIKLEKKYISDLVDFKKVEKKIVMDYNHDYYNIKRKFGNKIFAVMKNPIFKLLKNNVETGEVSNLKKISMGGGSQYRIDFYYEDKSNLYQVIFFILKNHSSLFMLP